MVSMKQEKRSIVRRRTQQLVYLELGKDNGGVMLNLSEDGCGFQAITPVKCGETRFGFQINGGRRIAGDAEIVWADESGVMGGLRFLNLPVEAHEEIRLWLAETNAPVENGFAPAAAKSFDGGPPPRRSRAVVIEEAPAPAPAASVRVAEEEELPPPPSWLNPRATTGFPAIEDDRYRMPYPSPDMFGDPHRKSAAVWRGIATLAILVTMAVVGVMYQHEIGTSLIWLGETLTGKTKALTAAPSPAPVPERAPAASLSLPASTQTKPPDSTSTNPATNLDDKTGTPQSAQDSDAAIEKELATIEHAQPSTPADAGATKAAKLGGTPSESGGRAESMLERQSGTPKVEPKWNEGDSVESLWGAVQAGSVSAEVSLAERFARGAGVSKNCDQAKVLMKAAAERGSKEARFRLYQMETQGCR